MEEPFKMKPMIFLPPEMMSPAEIAKLEANGVCVVVAKDPARVKFVDPIPAVSSRTKIEDAAIRLSRRILNPGFWTGDYAEKTRSEMTRAYVDILIEGTPLDRNPTGEELERRIFNAAKSDELRRLAKEEAKAERAAMKLKEPKDKPEKP